MKDKRIIKAAGILITFFLTGMMNTVLAVVTPLMNTQAGVSLLNMGLAVSVMSASRLILVIPAGILADKWSKPWVLRIGVFVIILGGILSGFAPFGFLFYLAMVLFGGGHAFMDGAANGLITDLYPEKPGSVLNLLHMFFGLGGMIGPLAFGLILNRYENWQYPFLFIGLTGLIIFLFIPKLRYEKAEAAGGIPEKKKSGMPLSALSGPLLYLCFMLFVMVGGTNTFKSFTNTFFEYHYLVTPMVASTALALINGGVTLGRLVWSMTAEKLGYNRILAFSFAGTLITGIGTLMSPSALYGMIFSFLIGIFMSPFSPISIAIGGLMLPDKKGALTGLFTVCASLGSMIFPALCGYIADQSGSVQYAMLILPLMTILPMILFFGKARRRLAEEIAAGKLRSSIK
jgi:MFS family permease